MPIEQIQERLSKMEAAIQRVADLQAAKVESDQSLIRALEQNIEKLNIIILGDGKSPGLSELVRGHGVKFSDLEKQTTAKRVQTGAFAVAGFGWLLDFVSRHIPWK